jgi:hypothetical protein
MLICVSAFGFALATIAVLKSSSIGAKTVSVGKKAAFEMLQRIDKQLRELNQCLHGVSQENVRSSYLPNIGRKIARIEKQGDTDCPGMLFRIILKLCN